MGIHGMRIAKALGAIPCHSEGRGPWRKNALWLGTGFWTALTHILDIFLEQRELWDWKSRTSFLVEHPLNTSSICINILCTSPKLMHKTDCFPWTAFSHVLDGVTEKLSRPQTQSLQNCQKIHTFLFEHSHHMICAWCVWKRFWCTNPIRADRLTWAGKTDLLPKVGAPQDETSTACWAEESDRF
jgi:hypothetical protein